MAVTGFVFGMVLLCALGVGMAAAGSSGWWCSASPVRRKSERGGLYCPFCC